MFFSLKMKKKNCFKDSKKNKLFFLIVFRFKPCQIKTIGDYIWNFYNSYHYEIFQIVKLLLFFSFFDDAMRIFL